MARRGGIWWPTGCQGAQAKAAATGALLVLLLLLLDAGGAAAEHLRHSNTNSTYMKLWLLHHYLTQSNNLFVKHRWRTYLRPDVKHPHLEPFTEWEAAVIVQAQREMGNNWLGEHL
jgi:hypothetical protein